MKYTLLKDAFIDNRVQEAGTVVDIADKDLAARLLERGTIVEGDVRTDDGAEQGGGNDTAAPLVQEQAQSEPEDAPKEVEPEGWPLKADEVPKLDEAPQASSDEQSEQSETSIDVQIS